MFNAQMEVAQITRKSFLAATISDIEFQLLPFQVVSPEMMEKTLAWQSSFAQNLPNPLALAVVIFSTGGLLPKQRSL